MIAANWGLAPAGSIFFIFATAAVGSMPHGAPVWVAAVVSAASAAFCVLLGAFAHLLGEGRAGAHVGSIAAGLSVPDLLAHGARFTIAPAVAGVLGILSTAVWPELTHPYWAMVAAVAPITPPHRVARVQRGVHRIIGTLGGVVVAAFILSFPAEAWQLVVWVILLQFLAEVFVARNYALALLFITPLALAMTQIAHPQDVGVLVTSRAVETALGAAVGLAVVLVGFRRRTPAH
jgi:uncharacterized membrane protein YccC